MYILDRRRGKYTYKLKKNNYLYVSRWQKRRFFTYKSTKIAHLYVFQKIPYTVPITLDTKAFRLPQKRTQAARPCMAASASVVPAGYPKP